MTSRQGSLLILILIFMPALSMAASTSIEAFAARQKVQSVTISPDGRYLGIIQTNGVKAAVVVMDRLAPQKEPRVVMGEPDDFRLQWCRFATNTRLLCGFFAFTDEGALIGGHSRLVGGHSRLVAVDADGSAMKVLVQNSGVMAGEGQDSIIYWSPGPADTVLIQGDEGLDANGEDSANTTLYNTSRFGPGGGTYAAPAVFELNIRTGRLKMRQHSHAPIRSWLADPQGNVRIGWSVAGTTEGYFAKLAGETDVHRISKYEAFSRAPGFSPVAISAEDPNKAYALAAADGRIALWLTDLSEAKEPELVFAHPVVSISGPLLSREGRLLGVYYENERPGAYYLDEHTRSVMAAVNRARPSTFNMIRGIAHDGKVFLITSRSDTAPEAWSVFDTESGKLSRVGEADPRLVTSEMGLMKPIWFKARDGAEIPGYLTLPRGGSEKNLPLIVMPHGGPVARDRWGWWFLSQFLVSRGYAVLQMNFRGSDGYGEEWFFAAHQDWGGLTYDDVVDGTRWAVSTGVADPKRVAIVGWSFGGYMALVGAQRDADLFRCAVSIAGISDLTLLVDWIKALYLDRKIYERQIGTDVEKLKHDSPRLHAANVSMPILMVHGSLDANVPLEQSEEMDHALSQAGKEHRLVIIPGADHSLSLPAQREILMRELEVFLSAHLGGPVPSTR
jgi:dipeptidyl aminopeptidase/acylaminoacyl peptidase